MAVGDNIRYLRTSKKLTLNDLGQELGVVASQVSAYENGKSYPSYSVLIKLMEFFNVTANDLVMRDLAKEGVEQPNQQLIDVDMKHIIGMYQRELENMRSKIEQEKDIPGLMDELEKISPAAVQSIRKKYNI